MASIQRMDAALNLYLQRAMRDFHTSLRARVVEVDYSGPTATVQPLATTQFDDETVDRYPAIYDVPIQVYGGNGGKARITVPIKPGDIVGLSFSERNEDDNSDLFTHGLNPGWAVTEIFPDGGLNIHPDNVEVWNDKVNFSMSPEGSFNLKTPLGSLTVDEKGAFKFSNGAANLEAKPDGVIDMNGAQVTPDGNIITKRGINLNDLYDYIQRHTHPYTWTDGGGSGNTNRPNP